MDPRSFLQLGGLSAMGMVAASPLAFGQEKSKLKITHTGGTFDCIHFIMATPNAPWAELFMPTPGGPAEVYQRFEEDNQITRGPEGVYARPSERPGFGWDIEVS